MTVDLTETVTPFDRSAFDDLAWDVLSRCARVDQHHPDHRGRVGPGPDDVVDVTWDPMSIGYGDLGAALALSAADEIDPDGGWDARAFDHVTAAVRRYATIPDLGVGLFAGTAAVAFTLRCLSRRGTRYARAIDDVDRELLTRTRRLLSTVDPEKGTASEDYDMVSGLAGVVTYVMTTDARDRPQLLDLARTCVACLTDLACATAGIGGLWTPGSRVTASDAARFDGLWAGALNLGYAHGIAGVLAVLDQALDHGVGAARTATAVDILLDILTRAADTADPTDVPYHLTVAGRHAGPLGADARSSADLSRYAWCYGNPGAALAITAGDRCRSAAGDLLCRLDSAGRRSDDQLAVDNPSLCHGYAGLAVIDRWVGTGDGSGWWARVAALADPTRPLGLRNSQLGIDQVDSPGFLDGSGGAAAAMLALAGHPEPTCLRAISGRWAA